VKEASGSLCERRGGEEEEVECSLKRLKLMGAGERVLFPVVWLRKK